MKPEVVTQAAYLFEWCAHRAAAPNTSYSFFLVEPNTSCLVVLQQRSDETHFIIDLLCWAIISSLNELMLKYGLVEKYQKAFNVFMP